MNQNVYLVSVADEGKRLDQFLKERTGLTRSEVQKWIKAGNVSLLPKKMIHSNYHVSEGDRISFFWEEKKKQELIGQNIPLDILYEDNDMIVINKRRGVVVHPGAGNTEGTLVNALLFHCGEQLRSVGDPERPGIVHRLDKDTSGVMVAAKSERAYGILQKEIASHKAQRCYIALVHGQMEGDTGVIRLPLGRSTKDRMKWDVLHETGRPAVTHFMYRYLRITHGLSANWKQDVRIRFVFICNISSIRWWVIRSIHIVRRWIAAVSCFMPIRSRLFTRQPVRA